MCGYIYVWVFICANELEKRVTYTYTHTHTMDFPISRCLLVRASTLPPVGIILRPGSVETPFGKLNFGSMCGMFVYGCDLLALREVPLGLLSRVEVNLRATVMVKRGGRRGRNLSISNPPSVVNSSIYTAMASDVSRTVLEASRNTTGRGRCCTQTLNKLHSSHIELISRILEAARSWNWWRDYYLDISFRYLIEEAKSSAR